MRWTRSACDLDGVMYCESWSASASEGGDEGEGEGES